MSRVKTIAVYDWDGSERAVKLARDLAENESTARVDRLVVLPRSDRAGNGKLLSDLGFRLVATADGSSITARKNVALGEAEGSLVLLSGEVELVDREWLEKLEEELEKAGGEGIIGSKVIDESGLVVNAGKHVIQPDCELLSIGGLKKDLNQYYYSREVEGVDLKCACISAGAVESAAEFDEKLSPGYDDIDYCLRVKAAGLPVLCTGTTRVSIHRDPAIDRAPGQFQKLEKARGGFRERWGQYYQDRYETKVMWHSWINAPTGYAVSSQYLVLAMEALDIDVRYGYVYGVEEPPNEDRRIMEVRRKPKDLEITQVVYGQGDVFFKNSGKYKIGYSMLEVTGIPADWVAQANALDEIWVPSHFNKETFASSGVEKPIYVMPLGVDVNYFHPFIKTQKQRDRYVFLSVFEWGERKAPELLIQAYNQEFSSDDDVVLVLKVINTDPGVNIERQIDAMKLRANRAPIVLVLNQDIPSYQMGSLYCSSDCFVLPTRGEGWGMPTLEAMACGLPVISTHWSAQTEFFNEEVGYPLKAERLIPAVAKCPYYEGYDWADPDIDQISSMMRYVYENRDEARAKGLKASVEAREKWTWMDSARRIKERLLEISG